MAYPVRLLLTSALAKRGKKNSPSHGHFAAATCIYLGGFYICAGENVDVRILLLGRLGNKYYDKCSAAQPKFTSFSLAVFFL